jgi:hypothetical protein
MRVRHMAGFFLVAYNSAIHWQDFIFALIRVYSRVAVPYPNWIRIQEGKNDPQKYRIRVYSRVSVPYPNWIRIQEGKNDPQK